MSRTVLQFGWEFPPNNCGGLGVACEGLTKGLINNGVKVLMVLPYAQESNIDNLRILSTNNNKLLKIKNVNSILAPYMSASHYKDRYQKLSHKMVRKLYGENIFEEVNRYTIVSQELIKDEEFDIIHAHDWMSIKAGVLAKHTTGKPLVFHIHATELDRTGGNGVNQTVYEIEKWGMQQADKVIAVSEFTKQKIIKHYAIDPNKIEVIHNAVKFDEHDTPACVNINTNDKIVLFLGRLTLQKGPDYFLQVAKRISEMRNDTIFVIAGSGDMECQLIDQAAHYKIGDKVIFTGFLRGADVDKIYKMASVFVMPSVSEPFGLTALESMKNGTPVILSKQSGVSEVITHCLKVDFWDIHDMVNKIIAVLDHSPLQNELSNNGLHEVKKFCWNKVACKCINNLYNPLW